MSKSSQVNKSSQELLIYLVLILLPTYLLKFTIFNLPLNVLDVIIIGVFVIFLTQDYKKINLGHWKYTMSAFALIGGIAVLVSNDLFAALGLYKSYIIEPMLIGIMILTIKPPLYRVLASLCAGMFFVSVIGLVQYVSGYGIPAPWNVRGDEFRITSIYGYPNAIGLLFAPIIAMLSAWIIHINKHRNIFIQLTVIAFVVLVLARTDGAVIAVMAAVAFSLLYTKWRWIVAGSLGASLIICFVWQPTREILLFQDTSGEVRLALWEGTINLLQDRPILGAGLAGFPELYSEYKLDRHVELLLYPHNIILDFWVELGLAGLIWLVAVVVSFFQRLWKVDSKQKIVLMAGMIAILVYGLVDVPYFKNDLAVLFWIIITSSSVLASTNKQH